MPEGDTIHRAARRLAAAIEGQTVSHAAAHPRTGIAAEQLTGLRVQAVEARAKHLLVRLTGAGQTLVLHTHLGMTGSWHLYRPGEPWRKPAGAMTVRLDTQEWVAVCFNAPRCELLSADALSRHPVLGRLGPDLAAADPDLAEARRRLDAQGARPLADVLLDQAVFAGVGNVYKSELCWRHRVHPLTPARALDGATRDALLADAARLLRANVLAASAARTTTGPDEPGLLAVYGRAGRPCRRCGEVIRSALLGQPPRRTAWCPRCQAEPAAARG